MNAQWKDNLADFTTDARVLILSGMAVVIGAISAGVAYGLLWLIALLTNIAFFQTFSTAPALPANHHLGPWVILVPVAGALIIGLMARFGSAKIRGHGIPEALEAILIGRSQIEPKVALLKPISSAISIGTGGPFGAEGPIIMTGGAFGSLFAQLFRFSSAERKTLLVAGAAAGMSAIFDTPIAAVLLAVELLLSEWKPRSFIPVAVASIVAALLRVYLIGPGPIFPIPSHAVLGPSAIGCAALVGLTAGLTSVLLTFLVYFFEDAFHKLPIHWMWWPALGALLVGVGGWLDPRVFGVGYDLIHDLLQNHINGWPLVSLILLKAFVWAVALGSGTSGGVLAPLLIIGGGVGALLGGVLPVGDPGLWALVGMGAIMGGTMRSPLTGLLFALELTWDLHALPALLAGCISALAVTVLLLRRSILTEKVARRGHHITREYSVDFFELIRVGDVMDTSPPLVPADMTVAELSNRIASGDSQVSHRQGLLVIDSQQALLGIVTRGDLLKAIQKDPQTKQTLHEISKTELTVTYPDELLRDAINKMLVNKIGRLPVVSRDNPRKIAGYLGRAEVMEARFRLFEEENVRETRLRECA